MTGKPLESSEVEGEVVFSFAKSYREADTMNDDGITHFRKMVVVT